MMDRVVFFVVITLIWLTGHTLTDKDFDTERTEWQRRTSKKIQQSIHQDDIPKSVNKVQHFQWGTYPVILEKKRARNKKQKILFKNEGQNNNQYGLRSMYKYGGQGIFGQITITE
ncbi:hypothetical protein ACH3XW_32405 [Acanthocheilonema viteae]